MNERIQELEQQCWEEAQREYGHAWFNQTKFAELIIQKCITQIALIGVGNFENEDIMWTVETSIASIETHFGVEE